MRKEGGGEEDSSSVWWGGCGAVAQQLVTWRVVLPPLCVAWVEREVWKVGGMVGMVVITAACVTTHVEYLYILFALSVDVSFSSMSVTTR